MPPIVGIFTFVHSSARALSPNKNLHNNARLSNTHATPAQQTLTGRKPAGAARRAIEAFPPAGGVILLDHFDNVQAAAGHFALLFSVVVLPKAVEARACAATRKAYQTK